jgi:hypothetical protein
MRPHRVAQLLVAASLVLVDAAWGMHPLPLGPRPLHLRLAEADVIALATVADQNEGRISLRDVEILRGRAPERFEIKRAPGNPPPLAVGTSALLLLRGARPPYVLVDEPRELQVLRDGQAAQVWREAVSQLLAAGSDRDAQLAVYLGWLDGGDDSLREAAGAALLDARSGLLPIGAARALERARAALDPARPETARRVSALLALSQPEAIATLLAGMANSPPDPQVFEIAVRTGLAGHVPAAEDLLLRSLSDPSGDIRFLAVRLAGTYGSGAALDRVHELATTDSDERVRREAQEVISTHGGLQASGQQ